MIPLRALGLTAVVALAPQLARAADMLPPPPPLEAPLRGAIIEESSGWYLRGDVGVGVNQISSTSSTFNCNCVVPGFAYDNSSIGGAAFAGIGAGYQFNNWFRADVTGEYRGRASFNTVESYTDAAPPASFCGAPAGRGAAGRCYDTYNGSVSSAVFLVNGYVDLGTWYGVTPYLGAGAGLAHHSVGSVVDHAIGNTGGGFSAATDKTNFAWALMAGLSYNVNRNLKLELGYRYLNMGQVSSGAIQCQPAGIACNLETQRFNLASHDIRLGMRWLLADGISSSGLVQTGYSLPSAQPVSPCGGCGGGGGVVTSSPMPPPVARGYGAPRGY